MNQDPPTNEILRKTGKIVDQRQQQIDPAGEHRADANEAAKRSQKQPGQDMRDPNRDESNGE